MAEKVTKLVTLIVVVVLAAILIGVLSMATKVSVATRLNVAKPALPLPPGNPVSAPKPTAIGQKIFSVQVASFSDKVKSDIVAEMVKKSGYSAVIVPSAMPDKKIWYRVLVGDFDTMEKAKPCLAEMQKLYKGSFIKQKN